MPDKPEVVLDRPTPTIDTPEAYSSEAWRNTWKILKEAPETRTQRFGVYVWYWLDRPVTWFRGMHMNKYMWHLLGNKA